MENVEDDLFKVGAVKCCVFGDCKSDSRRTLHNFIGFPKPCLAVRKQLVQGDKKHVKECILCNKCSSWLIKCKRTDGKFNHLLHVKRWHYICTSHFVNGLGPSEENPFPLTSEEAKKRKNLHDRKRRQTRNSTLINDDPVGWKKQRMENADVDCTTRKMEQADKSGSQVEISVQTLEITTQTISTQTTFVWPSVAELRNENQQLKKKLRQISKEKAELEEVLKREQTKSYQNFGNFVESLKHNERKCKFYTNLTFQNILCLLSFLGPFDGLKHWGTKTTSCNPKRNKLSHLEELVLLLVRLRAGLLVADLKYRFDLSTALISKIVITWVQLSYNKFNAIRPLMFSTRQKIKSNLPFIFKKLKNIRIIIDCAEFICESPSNYEHQGNLYSAYKATTTFKVLLGCTPNGVISFVSELFEGSISDKNIVIESKLIDFLEEGDLVLADRGFTISDVTMQKNVSLNIPPFLKGRSKLTAEEEIETKRIAKQRIYIEHVVGKVKKTRLLKKFLPLNMRGILSQMVFVCACLVNFQEPIIPSTNC